MKTSSCVRTIAFLGDYLPRKCGIATFTSDLLGAVAARHPENGCFAVPVNDIEGCYQYPDVVRFEIEEQDPDSYCEAADFLNASSKFGNNDVICVEYQTWLAVQCKTIRHDELNFIGAQRPVPECNVAKLGRNACRIRAIADETAKGGFSTRDVKVRHQPAHTTSRRIGSCRQ